jgi:hypothetical protein
MKSNSILILLFWVTSSTSWASQAEISTCLKQLAPLKNQKEEVAESGGIWGLFQKTAELKDKSVQGINLDNKINSILFHLDYLCNTIDGVPIDELGRYVISSLAEKGKDKFKEELINLGRSKMEIDIWFKFAEFAIGHQHRDLDPLQISSTIQSASRLTKGYLELAQKINEGMSPVIKGIKSLVEQIETFFKTAPYMSQAVYENSQIPYVDWDENHGGS